MFDLIFQFSNLLQDFSSRRNGQLRSLLFEFANPIRHRPALRLKRFGHENASTKAPADSCPESARLTQVIREKVAIFFPVVKFSQSHSVQSA